MGDQREVLREAAADGQGLFHAVEVLLIDKLAGSSHFLSVAEE